MGLIDLGQYGFIASSIVSGVLLIIKEYSNPYIF